VSKKPQAQLELCIGGYSDAGTRETNQDAFAVKVPSSFSDRHYKGIVASLADGVSCSNNAQQASQTSVTQFSNDYYATAQSWSVKDSASKVLKSLNSWLYQQSKADLRHNGLITTFSSIIFKSTTAHIFHVGDSRIYLYRGGQLTQLTHDHARTLYGEKSVLTRGLGMDCNVEIDYQTVALQQGDLFLLSSDGIHDYIPPKQLTDHLVRLEKLGHNATTMENSATDICRDALELGSHDNITCLILRIDNLPSANVRELFKNAASLIIPPALKVGNKLDCFRIDKVIYQGARSHVYLATDTRCDRQQILKIPSLNFVGDLVYLEGFSKEQWVGQRLTHPSIMKISESIEDSHFLYHICEYVEGITLRAWMQENPHPPIDIATDLIKKIVSAVRVLQRSAIVHRDLKPENIIVSASGAITLIDFGTVQIDGLDEISPEMESEVPVGALDYIAPEYLNGGKATSLSDLFSIGVITYELLCGDLPYQASTSQSLQKARAVKWHYRSIQKYRSDIPKWLDDVLKKATHSKINKRYSAMSEFVGDLVPTKKQYLQKEHKPSLLERNPLRFWKSLALLFFITTMVELFILLRH